MTYLWFLTIGLFTVACTTKKEESGTKIEPIIQAETGADKEYKATRSTKHVPWSRNAVIYEVNIRQYTKEGTFRAFQEHLPRLKELGIDILWLMPVTPISEKNRKGTMGSYYSVADYKKVNPEFGTEADFQALVKQAHELGMYVILDWVANHSGWDNPWIEENPEWYTQNEKGEIISPNPDWSDVADLNYDNPELRLAMIDAMKYWITEFDIDGYRCDIAGLVPTDFWNTTRTELDKIKPVFLLAEAWEPQLTEDAFDMAYAWDMHHIMNSVAKGEKKATALLEHIQENLERYAPDSYLMQFITNHDENSWQGTEYERMGDGVNSFAVLSFTIPGMPLLYSGQEAAFNKRLEFFEKDEIDWSNNELEAFYKKLIQLKHSRAVLKNGAEGGDFEVLDTNNEHVVAFARKNESEKMLVLLNLSGEAQKITLEDELLEGSYTDYFSGKSVTFGKSEKLELAPWFYQVLD